MNKLVLLVFTFLSVQIYAQDSLDVQKDKAISVPASTKEIRAKSSVSSKKKSGKITAIQSAEMNYLQSNLNRTRRSPSNEEEREMLNSVQILSSTKGNTFEFNFYSYVAGNYDVSLYPFLKKAYQQNPNHPLVQKQMAAYYVITKDFKTAIKFIDELFETGVVSKSYLNYSQDILASVPENGTLITHGFDDTYSLIYLQKEKGMRNDVQIISLDFLQSQSYRLNLQLNNYVFPSGDYIDVNYFSQFCELNESKNISTSLTVPKEYFEPILEKLYLTGLVMRYSSDQMDNFNRNEFLWSNQLKFDLIQENSDTKAKELSTNYLPMLFQLRKAYRMIGEMKLLNQVDIKIDEIAVFSGKSEKVQMLKVKY